MKEKIDWDLIERRPNRTTKTPSKFDDMITPTKAQTGKDSSKKNLQVSGSTVEATPTPKKNQVDTSKAAAAFEPRGTRSSAVISPEPAAKSKKVGPIAVKKSALVEPSVKKVKESGKSSKVLPSVSPRKGCQNELRRLLETGTVDVTRDREKRGSLRDEFDPTNRRKQARIS